VLGYFLEKSVTTRSTKMPTPLYHKDLQPQKLSRSRQMTSVTRKEQNEH